MKSPDNLSDLLPDPAQFSARVKECSFPKKVLSGVTSVTRGTLVALGLGSLVVIGGCSETALRNAPEDDLVSNNDDPNNDDPDPLNGDDDDDNNDDFSVSPGIWAWNPYEIVTQEDGIELGNAFTVLNGNSDFPGFSRVYSSFTTAELVEDPDTVGLWNSALIASGRTSDLLMGDNGMLCGISSRAEHIQAFIDFQESRTNLMERFRGIHVDLETHTDNPSCFYNWSDLTREERVTALNLFLLSTLSDIRFQLDEADMSDIEIAVDLPTWYDKIHDPENMENPENGLWNSELGRDAFFASIAAEVDSVIFLTYCRDNMPDILESVVTEGLLLPAPIEIRFGLDASHMVGGDGECETWGSLTDLNDMREDLEDSGRNTDTHHLGELMYIHFGG